MVIAHPPLKSDQRPRLVIGKLAAPLSRDNLLVGYAKLPHLPSRHWRNKYYLIILLQLAFHNRKFFIDYHPQLAQGQAKLVFLL
jgi:hypothetical protein